MYKFVLNATADDKVTDLEFATLGTLKNILCL